MGSSARADSVSGREMAMNEENPYRSPESTVEEHRRSPLREPLRTINHILNALWGAIFGAIVASIPVGGVSWLRGLLTFGCIAVGAVAGVWIGNITQDRSRLPRFRVGRHENTWNRPD